MAEQSRFDTQTVPLQVCSVCGFRNTPTQRACIKCGTTLASGNTTRDERKPSILARIEGVADEPKTMPPMPTYVADDANTFIPENAEQTFVHPLPVIKKLPSLNNPASETASAPKPAVSIGSDLFEDEMLLRLEIEGSPTPVVVFPSSKTIIGRRDPISSAVPDVDLSAYAAYRMGVSRQHAAFRRNHSSLELVDLGSSNGTFINGSRLTAHQPYLLHDGDEVCLGRMTLHVYFQTGAKGQ